MEKKQQRMAILSKGYTNTYIDYSISCIQINVTISWNGSIIIQCYFLIKLTTALVFFSRVLCSCALTYELYTWYGMHEVLLKNWWALGLSVVTDLNCWTYQGIYWVGQVDTSSGSCGASRKKALAWLNMSVWVHKNKKNVDRWCHFFYSLSFFFVPNYWSHVSVD